MDGRALLAPIALVAGWWFVEGDDPLALLRRIIGRGRRLSSSHLADTGATVESIEEIVGQVRKATGRDVSLDAVVMARVISSESPGGSRKEKTAIGWVLRNDADSHGWSIRYCATANPGNFGRQDFGRRYSTRGGGLTNSREIHEDDLAIAEAILSDGLEDPTGGARKFVHYTGFTRFADFLAARPRVRAWMTEAGGALPVFLGGVGALVVFVPRALVTENMDTGGYT